MGLVLRTRVIGNLSITISSSPSSSSSLITSSNALDARLKWSGDSAFVKRELKVVVSEVSEALSAALSRDGLEEIEVEWPLPSGVTGRGL